MKINNDTPLEEIKGLIVPTRGYKNPQETSKNPRFKNIQERFSLGLHRIGYAVLCMIGKGQWINHDAIAKNLIERVRDLTNQISTNRDPNVSGEKPVKESQSLGEQLNKISEINNLLASKGGFKGENIKTLNYTIGKLNEHIAAKEQDPELYKAKAAWCTGIKEIARTNNLDVSYIKTLHSILDGILIRKNIEPKALEKVEQMLANEILQIKAEQGTSITNVLRGKVNYLKFLKALDLWVRAVSQDWKENEKKPFLEFISSSKNKPDPFGSSNEKVCETYFQDFLEKVRQKTPAKLQEGTDQFINQTDQELYQAANNAFYAVWPQAEPSELSLVGDLDRIENEAADEDLAEELFGALEAWVSVESYAQDLQKQSFLARIQSLRDTKDQNDFYANVTWFIMEVEEESTRVSPLERGDEDTQTVYQSSLRVHDAVLAIWSRTDLGEFSPVSDVEEVQNEPDVQESARELFAAFEAWVNVLTNLSIEKKTESLHKIEGFRRAEDLIPIKNLVDLFFEELMQMSQQIQGAIFQNAEGKYKNEELDKYYQKANQAFLEIWPSDSA